MTAFNAVRFRVKSGRDQEFLDAHRKTFIAGVAGPEARQYHQDGRSHLLHHRRVDRTPRRWRRLGRT